MSDPSLTWEFSTLTPPPTGTHQLRSVSKNMNRRKRGHMSKESLMLNMPPLRLSSSQPVVSSVRKPPPSISDLPLSSLINGTSPTAPQWTGWDAPYPFACFDPLYSWCTLLDWPICQSSFTSWSGNCRDKLSVLLKFYPVISPFLLQCTVPSNSLGILFYIYHGVR